MKGNVPSIVIPIADRDIGVAEDPKGAARAWVRDRTRTAITAAGDAPGVDIDRLADQVAAAIVEDARVVYVLAEADTVAEVLTWDWADGDPPEGFLDAWTGSDALARRKEQLIRLRDRWEDPGPSRWPSGRG